MGKNSSASALKEPITNITPSSGRKTSTTGVITNSRHNATSTKATSSNLQKDEMATNNEVVLKSGWMTKRSQLKSIFCVVKSFSASGWARRGPRPIFIEMEGPARQLVRFQPQYPRLGQDRTSNLGLPLPARLIQ